MSDTLDLLEAIGGNAALRHASAEELAKTLAEAGASDALLAAVTAGDNAKLAEELGLRPMQVNHDSHTGGHEDDDETPDHGDGGEEPSQPSPPAQGGPSHS
ncbi:hypothetical protein [Dyella sp. C9]|uniref:hypothetical protein n=1 Tax=Dyella sp. C9 TaxID=2202154 RepID=UPI000DEEDACA|nr:hypothetical protein [Dyella sp. C9]